MREEIVLKLTKTQKNFIKQMKQIDPNYTGPVSETNVSSLISSMISGIIGLTIVVGALLFTYNPQLLSKIILDSSNSAKQTKFETKTTNSLNGSNIQPNKPQLELLEHSFHSDRYYRYVTGTVRNITENEYNGAFVEINLYDQSGAQIGNTSATTKNLEPGGLWKFEALVLKKEVASYKIKELRPF